MKTIVYDVAGNAGREVELPEIFSTKYNSAAIKRAVLALQSRRLQPKGTDTDAGFKTSAEYVGRRRAFRAGINIGMARLPHVKTGGGGLGTVKRVPQSRGGHAVHPPLVEKVLEKRINKKENRAAIRSAIAATANVKLVQARGHRLGAIKQLPIVIDSKLEALKKTKEAITLFEKLGLGDEITRAGGKKLKPGKRGTYKKRKSFLVVVKEDKGIKAACKNLAGVDVTLARELNAELLAPGTHAGRLTVWSQEALSAANEIYKRL